MTKERQGQGSPEDKIGLRSVWPATAGEYTPFSEAQLQLLEKFATADVCFVGDLSSDRERSAFSRPLKTKRRASKK